MRGEKTKRVREKIKVKKKKPPEFRTVFPEGERNLDACNALIGY